MKVFIDTNILVDLVCDREEFVEAARKIFTLGYEKKITLVLSPLSYINTFYIGKKYKKPEYALIVALQKIESFTETANFTESSMRKSLYADWKDLEDASQYYAAMEAGIDGIITRNPKDFAKAIIPIWQPQDFLALSPDYF